MRIDGWQPIWDKSIINEQKTTADFTVIEGKKENEIVLKADQKWEDEIAYSNIIKDGNKYRLYYLTHVVYKKVDIESNDDSKNAQAYVLDSYVCYAESADGINWIKPNLGICEFDGNTNNNIILRSCDLIDKFDMYDNFFVFLDDNPNCKPDEKYKAMVEACPQRIQCLKGYVSEDGIHFNKKYDFDLQGNFDTLNTCLFDKKLNKYVVYFRGFHKDEKYKDIHTVRDIRRAESEDFIHWTKEERLDYNGSEEYPLYTNNIMKYYRNENIYIGFPTRYVERQEWTDNYEQLCGIKSRKERMKMEARFGLSITDGIFMSSRDGKKWDKFDEAIFLSGYENDNNWTYGDGYPTYFMLETFDDTEKRISMYVRQCVPSWVNIPYDYLTRYTFRLDGFACYKAKYSGAKVVTNPFTFDGDNLYINFSTSARGNIYITIEDKEGNKATTCELFGDNNNRLVHFEGIDLSIYKNKEVILTFEMKDAKLYSFNFTK